MCLLGQSLCVRHMLQQYHNDQIKAKSGGTRGFISALILQELSRPAGGQQRDLPRTALQEHLALRLPQESRSSEAFKQVQLGAQRPAEGGYPDGMQARRGSAERRKVSFQVDAAAAGSGAMSEDEAANPSSANVISLRELREVMRQMNYTRYVLFRLLLLP